MFSVVDVDVEEGDEEGDSEGGMSEGEEDDFVEDFDIFRNHKEPSMPYLESEEDGSDLEGVVQDYLQVRHCHLSLTHSSPSRTSFTALKRTFRMG